MRTPESMPILRQIAQLGHPVLRTPTTPVRSSASVEVRTLIDDMLATLARLMAWASPRRRFMNR